MDKRVCIILMGVMIWWCICRLRVSKDGFEIVNAPVNYNQVCLEGLDEHLRLKGRLSDKQMVKDWIVERSTLWRISSENSF